MKASLLALLLVAPIANASPNGMTNQNLLDMGNAWSEAMNSTTGLSRDPHATGKASTYMGYVSGVGEATAGVIWCPKPDITVGQVGQVVISHLNALTISPNKPALLSVEEALAQAYPCAAKQH